MKKRKPIKLECQQNTPEKAFKSRIRNVKKLMKRLDLLVADASIEFEKTSTYWSHASSMSHIEDVLIEAVNFLSGIDEGVIVHE